MRPMGSSVVAVSFALGASSAAASVESRQEPLQALMPGALHSSSSQSVSPSPSLSTQSEQRASVFSSPPGLHAGVE